MAKKMSIGAPDGVGWSGPRLAPSRKNRSTRVNRSASSSAAPPAAVTTTRTIARHLGKHIPGNPTFVVENMTWRGHADRRQSHVYKARQTRWPNLSATSSAD